MPLTISLQPMTEADRDAMRRAGDFDAGIGRVALAFALAAAGIAAAWWAFAIIGVNVLLAMGLLIGGTIAATVGGAMLLGAGSRLLTRWRIDRELRGADRRGEVEEWVIEADMVWTAPSIDEDAGAVLLQVEPDRFIYVNAPWVDETQDEIEEPSELWKEFPPNWVIRRLPSPDGMVLSTAPGPERVAPLALSYSGEETAYLLDIAADGSWSLLVIERPMLPDSWRDCDRDAGRQAPR